MDETVWIIDSNRHLIWFISSDAQTEKEDSHSVNNLFIILFIVFSRLEFKIVGHRQHASIVHLFSAEEQPQKDISYPIQRPFLTPSGNDF